MTVGIVTYVHDWYMDYVPMFVRAWQIAYPDYAVRIFCRDKPPDIPGIDLRHFPSPHQAQKPYYMRWLLPPDAFEGLEYAFICDIDLLALREEPSLLEARKSVMAWTKRPYANWVRPTHPDYPSRITGWHFIHVQPYMDAVWPYAEKVLHDPNFDIRKPPSYSYSNGFGEDQWGQEALLYRLLTQAFALGSRDRATEDPFPNHHGLHLGPLRGGMPLEQLKKWIGKNSKFWEDKTQITALLRDQGLRDSIHHMQHYRSRLVLKRLYDLFDVRCPLSED